MEREVSYNPCKNSWYNPDQISWYNWYELLEQGIWNWLYFKYLSVGGVKALRSTSPALKRIVDWHTRTLFKEGKTCYYILIWYFDIDRVLKNYCLVLETYRRCTIEWAITFEQSVSLYLISIISFFSLSSLSNSEIFFQFWVMGVFFGKPSALWMNPLINLYVFIFSPVKIFAMDVFPARSGSSRDWAPTS